ncbi:MAG: DUF169 domain-containing protein [Candidatus Aenigmatarchaeota archaeon]
MNKKIDFENLHKKYREIIGGKGSPIGVKLIEKSELAKKLGIRPLESNLALCQALKLAGLYEKSRVVSFENIDACVVGSYILGFSLPPEDLKERWIKGFAYDPQIFDELCKNIEALPQKKFEAAIIAPLKEFDKIKQEPDAVIMFVNSSQAYMLLVGYFDVTGKKTVSSFNGHAACEIIAAVANGKSPWLTIPCGGARSIADAQDDEIWLGMKVNELLQSLKRLEKTNFKYPPAVNQMVISSPNENHPLTYLISRKPKV